MAKGLTAKQEKFCVEYVNGGMSLSDAYRASFNCSKLKPESVNTLAHRLSKKVQIRSRIKELQSAAAEEAKVTLAGHLEDLKRLRDAAEEKGQFAAAINAEIFRGKVSGLYGDRAEISSSSIPIIKPVIELPVQKPEDKSDANG